MKCYSIYWDFGNNPIIEGRHKWHLPGVKCPICGSVWGNQGSEYPAIDLSTLRDANLLETTKWPVPLNELEELRKPIRALLPPHLPLPPGTAFGPIIGKALAKLGDFAWMRTFTPLISDEALTKLRSKGLTTLMVAAAEIRFRWKHQKRFWTLHIEPRAIETEERIAKTRGNVCSACGFLSAKASAPLLIRRSSIPEDQDLFRVVEWETQVLASERFAETVQSLGLSDIKFTEVAVSENE